MVKKLIGIVLFFISVNVTMASATSPTEQVRGTVDAILQTLKQDGLTQEARRSKIRELIQKRFHFRVMSQRTLATNWKKATEEEKKSFVELFSKLLEQTYIGKIEAYTDERVEYVKEKRKAKSAVVDTMIVTKSVSIPISYKVLLNGDEWQVYDVKVEDVSLISNYRSSYAQIVQNEGIPGLLVKMQQKIEELKIGGDAQATSN